MVHHKCSPQTLHYFFICGFISSAGIRRVDSCQCNSLAYVTRHKPKSATRKRNRKSPTATGRPVRVQCEYLTFLGGALNLRSSTAAGQSTQAEQTCFLVFTLELTGWRLNTSSITLSKLEFHALPVGTLPADQLIYCRQHGFTYMNIAMRGKTVRALFDCLSLDATH